MFKNTDTFRLFCYLSTRKDTASVPAPAQVFITRVFTVRVETASSLATLALVFTATIFAGGGRNSDVRRAFQGKAHWTAMRAGSGRRRLLWIRQVNRLAEEFKRIVEVE